MNQAVPHTFKVMQDRLFVLECRTLEEDACDIQPPTGSRAVDDLLRSVKKVSDVIVSEGGEFARTGVRSIHPRTLLLSHPLALS
jgi:hypothetical protein